MSGETRIEGAIGARIQEIEERQVQTAERVVRAARSAGADHAEALALFGRELSAKVRLGAPELVEQAQTRALGLRVLVGGRQAVCHTADLSESAIEGFVRRAVELAAFSEEDPHALPPEPEELAQEVPDLALHDPAVADLGTEEALALAQAAEQAARDLDPRICNSEGAQCQIGESVRALATSGGFAGSYAGSSVSLSVEPVADDVGGKKRNGHHWDAARHLARLADPAAVGREAARRTLEQLGARKVFTAEVPVIFSPEAGAQVLRTLFGLVSGSAVYRKATYLLERESTVVASPLVTVVDDPLIPAGPGSRPFDGDGLASRRNVVVDGGRLVGFLCDTYAGRRLGRSSTASAGRGVASSPSVAASNFRLQPGGATSDEIIASTPKGLYVRRLMGFGFNPVTGDFSKGAEGYWIEGGSRSHPVSEVTISASFDDLLQAIDAVGQDIDTRSRMASPTFRVSRMTVAGR